METPKKRKLSTEEEKIVETSSSSSTHCYSHVAMMNLNSMYLNVNSGNVIFVFFEGNHELLLPAHKNLLANASLVFRKQFYGADDPEKSNETLRITISDAKFEVFRAFLLFFYYDDVQLTKTNIADVMVLMRKYEVKQGFSVCERFLMQHLAIDETLMGYELAIRFELAPLKQFFEEKIRKSAKAVFTSIGFLKCSQSMLKSILSIEVILCDPIEIFDACIAWAQHACTQNVAKMESLREKLGDCMQLIPFRLMKPRQVVKCIRMHKDLFEKEDLIDLIDLVTINRPLPANKFEAAFIPTQPASDSIWDCLCVNDDDAHKYWVEQVEVTTFDLRRKCYVTAVKFFDFRHVKLRYDEQNVLLHDILSGKLKIVEKLADGKKDVMIEQKVDIECSALGTRSSLLCKLARPILCENGKKYDIQVEFDLNFVAKTYYTVIPDGRNHHRNGIAQCLLYSPIK